MAINGMETGAFGGSDAQAFMESPAHARDVNQQVTGSGWQFLNVEGDPLSAQILNNNTAGLPNPQDFGVSPYEDGTWAIMHNDNSHQWPIGTPEPPQNTDNGRIITPDGFQKLTPDEYYQFPAVPEPGFNVARYGFIYVAQMGQGSITIKLMTLFPPGKYSGSVFAQSGVEYIGTTSGEPLYDPAPFSFASSYQLISQDGSQSIDITPGNIPPNQSVPLAFDSVALFGRRTPFFPQLIQGPVSSFPPKTIEGTIEGFLILAGTYTPVFAMGFTGLA